MVGKLRQNERFPHRHRHRHPGPERQESGSLRTRFQPAADGLASLRSDDCLRIYPKFYAKIIESVIHVEDPEGIWLIDLFNPYR